MGKPRILTIGPPGKCQHIPFDTVKPYVKESVYAFPESRPFGSRWWEQVMRRAVGDPADSPPLHPPGPFPWLSCCGSHGLAPARLQGPSISTPPATTAERSPALLAGKIGFPATKAPLAPGDQPSSLVTRPLFSSETVITHGCSEAREQSHFVSVAKKGPAWLLYRWGGGSRGGGTLEAEIAGWSSTRMPVGTACESRPHFASHMS